MIGDLARRLLDLHRTTCAADVAEPRALAKWMVRFSFEDQDFFEIDPVAYVDAMGETGLAVYRREVTTSTASSGSRCSPPSTPRSTNSLRRYPWSDSTH